MNTQVLRARANPVHHTKLKPHLLFTWLRPTPMIPMFNQARLSTTIKATRQIMTLQPQASSQSKMHSVQKSIPTQHMITLSLLAKQLSPSITLRALNMKVNPEVLTLFPQRVKTAINTSLQVIQVLQIRQPMNGFKVAQVQIPTIPRTIHHHHTNMMRNHERFTSLGCQQILVTITSKA